MSFSIYSFLTNVISNERTLVSYKKITIHTLSRCFSVLSELIRNSENSPIFSVLWFGGRFLLPDKEGSKNRPAILNAVAFALNPIAKFVTISAGILFLLLVTFCSYVIYLKISALRNQFPLMSNA
jgi:hypothetical protein